MRMFAVCCFLWCLFCFFFFKQKTAYEMRISDWSSDVCSSDLRPTGPGGAAHGAAPRLALHDLVPHLVSRLPAGPHGHSGGAALEIHALVPPAVGLRADIGRASCRERVCQ